MVFTYDKVQCLTLHVMAHKRSKKKSESEKYVPQDAKFFEAKERGFVARSALKLEELDRKHNFFTRGGKVLDLGCAPGSWLQYASRRVGPTGKVVGFDIDEVRVNLSNVSTAVLDLYDLDPTHELIAKSMPFDLVQSDAMTKTTGIPDTDCARSIGLVERGLWLASQGVLKKGGTFVAKVFEGPGFTEFLGEFKKKFSHTSVNRPEATRKGRREVYVVGAGLKISQKS
jgi:23S rRNA (uridine2552-2'-O)-methyltransferase